MLLIIWTKYGNFFPKVHRETPNSLDYKQNGKRTPTPRVRNIPGTFGSYTLLRTGDVQNICRRGQ